MNSLSKIIATLVLVAAVMGYTTYNYVTGKTTLIMFVVCIAILGIPFINIINILIRDLRNK